MAGLLPAHNGLISNGATPAAPRDVHLPVQRSELVQSGGLTRADLEAALAASASANLLKFAKEMMLVKYGSP